MRGEVGGTLAVARGNWWPRARRVGGEKAGTRSWLLGAGMDVVWGNWLGFVKLQFGAGVCFRWPILQRSWEEAYSLRGEAACTVVS